MLWGSLHPLLEEIIGRYLFWGNKSVIVKHGSWLSLCLKSAITFALLLAHDTCKMFCFGGDLELVKFAGNSSLDISN